jgi:polar amino acid transport system substrate-binding protein
MKNRRLLSQIGSGLGSLLLAGILVTSFCAMGFAGDYTASLAKMPIYAESEDQGVLVDLTKAIAEVSGNNISIKVQPFKRSMMNVIRKEVDFHMPLIKNPNIPEKDLEYDHSTETIFHVNFVLYTNKDKPLDLDQLDKYKIETDAAHVQYFPFKTIPSSSIEGSLKKVSSGRIDGFVFADNASDPVIKSLNLTNIHRQLYKRFDVKIILSKGERGKDVDQMLGAAIKQLKDSGDYDKIMGQIDQEYQDWQP